MVPDAVLMDTQEELTDLLDRKAFVARLIDVVEILSENRKNASFAVNGAWGVGKTFVLNRFEEEIAKYPLEKDGPRKYLVFHYDCWKYDYYEEPLIALVAALTDSIDKQTNFISADKRTTFKVVLKEIIAGLVEVGSVKTGFDIKKIFETIKSARNKATQEIADSHDFDVYFKIDAERKILWYHNGAYEKNGRDCKRDKAYYPQFDFIIAVSQDCRRVLTEKFESAASKILTLMNFYDIDDIRSKAQEPLDVVFSSDFVNIVTVARLTEEKGADIALAACKNLIDCGKKIRWYWIGDGNRSGNIEKEIAASHLQETFILMGNKANPYPYMGAADIYVQPSYYEAYSTTVFEAKALGKVIVATDVGGMRDQIETKKNGIIVPVNAVAISDAICMLLNDDKLYGQIRSAVQQTTFDPESNMEAYRKSVFE